MDNQNVVNIILENRVYQYQILQLTFADSPDQNLLKELFSDRFVDSFSLALEDDPSYEDALHLLAALKLEYSRDTAQFLDRLHWQYSSLFVGPGKLPVSPWESIWVEGGNTIFGETTLAVRSFFAKNGFRSQDYPSVADDHIAIELDFMRAMAEKSASNPENALDFIDVQIEFLNDHLIKLLSLYADEIQKHDDIDSFYKLFAMIGSLYVESDIRLLKELREAYA